MSLLFQLRDYELRMRKEGQKSAAEGEVAGQEGGEMPFMYASQNVRWVVNLRGDGTVKDVQPRSSGKKGKELGLPMPAPNLVRAGSGAKPRLLMDNAEYVLGIVKEESQKGIDRARKFHQAYVELVRICADETGEPSVRVVAAFLGHHTPETFSAEHLTSYPDFTPDTNVMFVVDGVNPLDLPSVRQFWARQFGQDDEQTPDNDALIAECLITGEVGPVIKTEPVKVKGIQGGQTMGMNFISANAKAFESYGLEQSRIAPVKFEAAEAYANGLNRLLADPNTSLKLGGMTYAFWTAEGAVPLVSRSLKEPPAGLKLGAGRKREKKARTEEVRQALWGLFTGQQPKLTPGAAFYAAGFTPSGSRIAVRTHLSSTVQDAVNHLADYFLAQSLVMVNPEGSKFPDRETFDLYALVGAMYRDPSKAHTQGDVDALVQFALSGQPLPSSFLVRLAARSRADENRVTRPRAVLTKMVLLSRDWKESNMDTEHLEALNPARSEPAYHLGRLLAVLDDIQSSVMKANTTLVDRFYGSMSTTPYAVVGRLIQGSQAHLQKLRKDNEGAYFAKQRELEGVMGRLSDIPAKPLTTPQQALFALGYYHQRAEISAGIRERSAAKKDRDAAKTATPDAQPTTQPSLLNSEGES